MVLTYIEDAAGKPVAPSVAYDIVRSLETAGETEITTPCIGELVMKALAGLDSVAYIRYASVYKNFREPEDFDEFLDHLKCLLPPREAAE